VRLKTAVRSGMNTSLARCPHVCRRFVAYLFEWTARKFLRGRCSRKQKSAVATEA
jgi:hypothetical protein